MGKRVLLLGAYGQNNIGDETLLEVFLRKLENCSIFVGSRKPEDTSKKYGVPSFRMYGDYRRLLRLLISSDVIIFGGGSLLKELNPYVTRRWRYSVLFFVLASVILGKLLGKKVVFSAISVGRLKSTFSKILVKITLMFVDMITVRDEYSGLILQKLGYGHALVVADPTLLVRDFRKTTTSVKNLNRSSRLKVGICPVYNFEDDSFLSYSHLVKTLSRFADYVVEEYGAEVFLIPFQAGYGFLDDLKLNKSILRHVKHKSRIFLVSDINSVEDMLSLFEKMDLVIGMRLHSIVFSFLERKPFLAIIYNIKVENFLKDVGLEKYSVKLSEFGLNELKTKFKEVMNEREDIIEKIERKIPLMMKKANLNFEHLKLLLEA